MKLLQVTDTLHQKLKELAVKKKRPLKELVEIVIKKGIKGGGK